MMFLFTPALMFSSDNSHLIKQFIEKTEQLDNLRGESTKNILPELKVLWEQDKKTV